MSPLFSPTEKGHLQALTLFQMLCPFSKCSSFRSIMAYHGRSKQARSGTEPFTRVPWSHLQGTAPWCETDLLGRTEGLTAGGQTAAVRLFGHMGHHRPVAHLKRTAWCAFFRRCFSASFVFSCLLPNVFFWPLEPDGIPPFLQLEPPVYRFTALGDEQGAAVSGLRVGQLAFDPGSEPPNRSSSEDFRPIAAALRRSSSGESCIGRI